MFVFSGSGNTLKISEKYKDIFELKNNNVELTRLTLPIGTYNLDNTDYLGIFYPIHGFNAPSIILDFAKALPVTQNQKYFIAKTSGEPLILNNASSLKLISILSKKGYILTNEYSYVMPYNMIFRHDDGFASKMFRTAKELVEIDAREILSGNAHFLKKCPLGRPLSFVVRIEHPAMRVNGKMFKVNSEKCIECMKCIKNCPAKNITFQNGNFEFGNKCLMCTACSFNCPKDAISIGILNGWRVNGQYSFNQVETMQENSHTKFCVKSYKRYFNDAEKQISLYKK